MSFGPGQFLGIGETTTLLPALLGRSTSTGTTLAGKRLRTIFFPRRGGRGGERERENRRADAHQDKQTQKSASQAVPGCPLPGSHAIFSPGGDRPHVRTGSLFTRPILFASDRRLQSRRQNMLRILTRGRFLKWTSNDFYGNFQAETIHACRLSDSASELDQGTAQQRHDPDRQQQCPSGFG